MTHPLREAAMAALERHGITGIDPGFRWDANTQHHVPNLLIEFTPVPGNGPCDAKGWKDRDALAAALSAPEQAAEPAQSLTQQLQQKCSDWGVYWRAPDAHGVNLTLDRALELLRDALGVEVEFVHGPYETADECIAALNAPAAPTSGEPPALPKGHGRQLPELLDDLSHCARWERDEVEGKKRAILMQVATLIRLAAPGATHTDEAGQATPPSAAQAEGASPAGWVPLRLEWEPGYPEDVAFGPPRMMERLKKWLDKHFAAKVAATDVVEALDYVDDFIARCTGDDRGACNAVNVLRRALTAAPEKLADCGNTPYDEGPFTLAAPEKLEGPTFQRRVEPWLLACFGAEIAADTNERSHRFIEEALELVQACGTTASEAHQLVDYVYGRPVGERSQEVGGVMVTLAALCRAHGIDMHQAGEVELARIWTKVEQIRAKQAAKPKHSPLPAAPAPHQQAAQARLIGWRTDDYLMETADKAKADNWSAHFKILPIFEGDPHTKLEATPPSPQQAAQGGERPTEPGWYVVGAPDFDEPTVRAFGKDGLWWIPLGKGDGQDGWMTGREYRNWHGPIADIDSPQPHPIFPLLRQSKTFGAMPDPTPAWRLVPPEPTAKQLDAAVAFALNVSLSAEYSWSAYMRDLYLRFLEFAPTPPAPQAMPPITLPEPVARVNGMLGNHASFTAPPYIRKGDAIFTADQLRAAIEADRRLCAQARG